VALAGLRFVIVRPVSSEDEALSGLRGLPGVSYVTRDLITPRFPVAPDSVRVLDDKDMRSSSLQSDSSVSSDPLVPRQWHIGNDGSQTGWTAGADIGLAEAWRHTRGRPEVVIAIGEEGYDAEHPDLQGIFVDDSLLLTGANNGSQHGTFVVGVVSAQADNNIGGVGIAPNCKILVVHTGYGTSTVAMLKALEKVLQWNATVFTNSWGYQDLHGAPLQEAYEVVARAGRNGRGTLVLFAAGNERRPWVAYPGWYQRFISVGGTTPSDKRWNGSSYGLELDVVAPADGIITTISGGGYGGVTGTSFATPIVAGIAGLIASVDTLLTADSIRSLIETTTDCVGGYVYDQPRRAGMWNPWMGYGRVNAGRAVRAALGLGPTAPALEWPRGGEELRPGQSYTLRWRSNRPVTLLAQSLFSGTLDTVASSEEIGEHRQDWVPDGADLIRLQLVDRTTAGVIDSTSPITVRLPAWTVDIDTTAPFNDVRDIPDSERIYVARSPTHLITPFDLELGGDTAWVWNLQPWGCANAPANDPRVFQYPTMSPGVAEPPALFSLVGNDLVGVDSTTVCLIDNGDGRTAIIQYDGMRMDSAATDPALRAAMAGMRRQIRVRERDGSIVLAYDRDVESRRFDPLLAQQSGYVVGMRTGRDFLMPFDSLFVQRIPSGTITFTPLRTTVRTSQPRTGLFRTTARTTYGYDVYRGSVITSGTDSVNFRTSTDNGSTWTTVLRLAPPVSSVNYLIPTRHNGQLLVAVDGVGSLPRADTLEVYDHGYVIEELDPSAARSVADDPRAAIITIPASDDEFVLPLIAPFPFFRINYPRIAIGRDGTVVPVDAQGQASRFPQVNVYPRFGRDNPDRDSPVHVLLETIDGRTVTVVEWDSLSTFGDLATHRPRAQVQFRSDGVIDVHMFDADTVTVPYYTPPSIGYDGMVVRPSKFTLRANPQGPIDLPLGSWRFTPHTPKSTVDLDELHSRGIMTVRPIPARDVVMIDLARSGRVDLLVYDLMGRMVARLDGEGMLTWNLDGIPEGVYIVEDPQTGQHAFVVRQ